MGKSSGSSDDDRGRVRSTFEKLNRHNWATWRNRFQDIVTTKGYERLMNPEWVKVNKDTAEYRQMSAWTMTKLYGAVKEELHPVLTAYHGDIYGAFTALSTACGEKSVIRLCDKLFTLINSTYNPGSSLADHVTTFRRHYSALEISIKSNPNVMSISTGLAAAFLLQSLNQDDSMTSLVQTLYNMKPLTFNKVYDRLLIEATQQTSVKTECVYFASQNRKFGKQSADRSTGSPSSRGIGSSRGNYRGGNFTRGNFQGVTPTRPAPNSSNDLSDQVERLFKAQMKKYMGNQANFINPEVADAIHDSDQEYDDDPDDSGFMVLDKVNSHGIPTASDSTTLILDSAASKSTLCDLKLLLDPKPVVKAVNTYSGSIRITHVGKFNLGGVLIYPVFYAPNGPRNLISMSQLEDHGLRSVVKNRLILIRLGEKVVYRFPQVGSLYQGAAPRPSINYAMNVSEPDPSLDYHILLGHPSDEYLQQFLKLYNITPVEKNQLAKHCEICKQCKLKRAPHSNPLPTTDPPSKTLHIDVLQITPPSKSSMKYVLVIIDDYSRFNRIYLMQRKSDSKGKILSYVNEILNKTGIRIEAGLVNSPQTNGLAEQFNQTLLVKIRCLLAQSSVPINYWDKTARYASTLINILPSKALSWSSPVNVLAELNMCIEPIRDVNKLVPFGLKVYVSQRPPSKISVPSRPLICLGYEDHSDALRFFDSTQRHIVISRDYTPSKISFLYNSSASLFKPPDTLPKAIRPPSDSVTFSIPSPSLSPARVPTPKTRSRTPPGTLGQQMESPSRTPLDTPPPLRQAP
ncbi:hypothetical protein PCASD_21681 [Puccinia coronata f. sp. avenae]|uniref:Integrase catalytic domain-containing protein n=1 Tax=Puccinia coronata f. sp. avenae TaxID=200324 RepID=A0A2N5U376_9BASI|nr:hypothetical protein PCASD_21681 [Puccinia coronata f. sp. avenae]